MLRRLRLVDFKSFANEAVELAPLTLLVGANASGKSNCLDALRFLHETRVDQTIAEILDGEQRPGSGPNAWQGLRGGSKEASRIGAESFLIESTWAIPDAEISRPNVAMHRIRCRTAPRPAWDEEGIYTDDARALLAARALAPGDGGARRVEWTSPSGSDETAHWNHHSILWTILGNVNPGYPRVITDEAVDVALALDEAFKNIIELDITPARMRDYGKTNRDEMDFNGGNFSGALWALCRDPEQKRSLVDWLTEVLAPEIADLDFIHVQELGDVMAMLVERDGKRVSARSLSDGTLRFLGMLVALRTAAAGSVFLIEEIDGGLHPARLHVLVEFLEALARERRVQIIATTHSPVMLQAVSRETLRSAVVFGRIPEREGTIMRRLGDLPRFEETLERTEIDELFATGWLEMAL
jgi:ABC-type branched-subunit amino acid transport system ATPase component